MMGGWQNQSERDATAPRRNSPYAPYPQRTPAAPSRPMRSGPPPASPQRTGGPPPTAPTPGWRRWLPIISGIVAGIVVVAIVLAALVFLRGQRQPAPTNAVVPTPSPTARTFCADLLAQRYTAAYGLLTPDLQRQGTEAQYVASQRELDALQGRMTTCAVGKIVITNTGGVNATAALTITRARTQTTQAMLSLAWSSAAWRISAYDTSVL